MFALIIVMAAVFVAAKFAEESKPAVSIQPQQATENTITPLANWKTADSSQLIFSVDVLGSNVEGNFKRFDAAVNFAPDSLNTSSINATIYTESIFTDNSTRDEMLPEADWFAVQKYALAEFNTGEIRSAGDNNYIAEATLRIRDVTREIEFPFHWQQTGDTATLSATVTLSRLDYQLGANEFSDADTIAFTVPVKVFLELTR